MLKDGIEDCVHNMLPVKFELLNGERVEIKIENCTISSPQIPIDEIKVKTKQIYPSECRQRAITYKGMCNIRVGWSINGFQKSSIDKDMGELPIMVKV